ncbi:MAG: hypothetical protein RLN69_07220 [Woeseiaceae bacterium]
METQWKISVGSEKFAKNLPFQIRRTLVKGKQHLELIAPDGHEYGGVSLEIQNPDNGIVVVNTNEDFPVGLRPGDDDKPFDGKDLYQYFYVDLTSKNRHSLELYEAYVRDEQKPRVILKAVYTESDISRENIHGGVAHGSPD